VFPQRKLLILSALVFAGISISLPLNAEPSADKICRNVLSNFQKKFPAYKILRSFNRYDLEINLKKNAGYITFNLPGDDLHIMRQQVKQEFRKEGVGTALFAQLLLDHPEIKTIHLTLGLDNESEFDKALKLGKSPVEAAETTPTFKIAKKFGFHLNKDQSYLGDKSAHRLVLER
jgi:hypothetical protein